jgi:hypothetical protein
VISGLWVMIWLLSLSHDGHFTPRVRGADRKRKPGIAHGGAIAARSSPQPSVGSL